MEGSSQLRVDLQIEQKPFVKGSTSLLETRNSVIISFKEKVRERTFLFLHLRSSRRDISKQRFYSSLLKKNWLLNLLIGRVIIKTI